MRSFSVLLVALLFASSSLTAQDVGEPIPDFTLMNLSDDDVTLSDLQGKVVGLYLFGHACPFCINAAPTLQTEVYDVYKDDPDFVMLGLDTWDGSKQQVELFKNTVNAQYELLQKAGNYESTIRSTYDRFIVVDRDGVMRFKGTSRISSQIEEIKQGVADALALVSTSNEEEVPERISLHQNYPNPFNPTTQISFDLAQAGEVSLQVFSPLGAVVRELAQGQWSAGSHVVSFDMGDLPSGVYVYRLQASDQVLTRVMTLLR